MSVCRRSLAEAPRLLLCSQTSYFMGYIAEVVHRFFHPAATEEMLATFVPLVNGTVLDV